MPVFRDRRVLSPSYLPPRLRHRESELSMLVGLLSGGGQRAQVVGEVGVGKTSLCMKAAEALGRWARGLGLEFRHVYVNLRLHSGSRVVLYRRMAWLLSPKLASQSLSAEELLRNMLAFLGRGRTFALFTLDEVDSLVGRRGGDGGSVVYDLTRLSEAGEDGCSAAVVFTARGGGYASLLDPAERSSLGLLSIRLSPYSPRQMADILQDRVEAAFENGAVDEEVVSYVADVAASSPYYGVRYGLDVLLFAGNLAEARGEGRVTTEHVREVASRLAPGVSRLDLEALGAGEAVALLSLARALKVSGSPYVRLRDVREACRLVCEEEGLPVPEGLEELLQRLADKGLVEVRGLTRIGISGSTAAGVEAALSRVVKRFTSCP